jgi:hypothetical protein
MTKITLTFHELTYDKAAELLAVIGEEPKTEKPKTEKLKTEEPKTGYPKENQAGTMVDARGYPWDHRIHGSGKTCSKVSGEWKKKKLVEPELVQKVENEYDNALKTNEAETQKQPDNFDLDFLPRENFPDITKQITSELDSGKLTKEKLNELLNEYGLSSLPLLAARPDLISSFSIAINNARCV